MSHAHERARTSLLRRTADACYRRRRTVLLGWVVLSAALVAVAGAAAGELDNDFDLPGAESQEAADLLRDRGFADRAGTTIQVVVSAPGRVDDPAVRAGFEALLADVERRVDDVAVVSPYEPGGERQVSGGQPDGSVAFADLYLADRSDTDFAEAGDEIVAAADEFDVAGANVELGGDPVIVGPEQEFGSEAFGMLAAMVILLIAFGSVLAMGLPLVTAIFGIVCGTAIVQLVANVVTMPTFTLQLVMMLGIGVGIDYALFIVTRYRQELHEGRAPRAAVVESLDTAGRAVLFAGSTVVISVLGLFAMGLSFTRSLAVAAALGVLLTMLSAVTLLPAILGFVGTNIDRLGLPHRTRAHGGRGGIWHRWSRVVQRRPLTALVAGLAALLVLAVPLFAIRLGFSDNGNRPADDTTRRAYDALAEGFGEGFNGPLLLVADLPNGTADLDTLTDLRAQLASTDGIATATPPVANDAGTAAIMQVVPTTSPQDEATSDLVHRLRDDVLPEALAGSGLDPKLGGITAAAIDFSDYAAERLPMFIGVVLLLSFLLLMATFRSVLVPIKAVIMNLLSIGAAYGVVVAVFQWGWAADVLGVGDPGPVEAWAPMMLFAIVFGLSMDYEVFLLSRMKEEYDRTGDNALAVADGLASTARLITAAAAIMFFVFGGFVLSADRALQLFGMGLAVAVLVDATIVRLVLVPATMELLGDRNWWLPGWLDRIVPRVHVEGRPGPALVIEEAVDATSTVDDDDAQDLAMTSSP